MKNEGNVTSSSAETIVTTISSSSQEESCNNVTGDETCANNSEVNSNADVTKATSDNIVFPVVKLNENDSHILKVKLRFVVTIELAQ